MNWSLEEGSDVEQSQITKQHNPLVSSVLVSLTRPKKSLQVYTSKLTDFL